MPNEFEHMMQNEWARRDAIRTWVVTHCDDARGVLIGHSDNEHCNFKSAVVLRPRHWHSVLKAATINLEIAFLVCSLFRTHQNSVEKAHQTKTYQRQVLREFDRK